MVRISDAEIARLKTETPIAELVSSHGVSLRRHGADLIGLCPFHGDTSPSFVVSPKKNLWHCLGACRAGGSVIDFVMKAEKVSFRDAVEHLRQRPAPKVSTHRRHLPHKRPSSGEHSPVEAYADGQKLLDQVADYYHRTLKASSMGLAYLEKRGILSMEMIDHFKLGFSDQTLNSLVPNKDRKDGAELRTRLLKLGILMSDGRERMLSSIVIPILDVHGSVTGMYGRRVLEQAKGAPVHHYLPGPHQGVWNAESFQAGPVVILCEALIDGLTFWSSGFPNVTSSYGVDGFMRAHLELLLAHKTAHVVIAYDRDDAGDSAAEALAKKLLAEGIGCWRVEFPKGMDANAYAQKLTPAAKSLGLVLKKARWMGTASAPAHPYEGLELALVEMPFVALRAKAPKEAEQVATASPEEEATTKQCPPLAPELSPTDIPPPFAAEGECACAPSAAPGARSTAQSDDAAGAIAASPEPPAELSSLAEPAVPAVEIPVEHRGEGELVMRLGDRRYRVRGLFKNLSYDLLKVNLLVAKGESFFVDTLDLYSARHRALYLKQAVLGVGVSEEILKKDLGKILVKLEALQEAHIQKTLEPKDVAVKLTEGERMEALELLKDPKLLDRVLLDFEACGIVGEETNKLMGYLAFVSRKLEEPLAVIIQSSSAAGKTSLMEAVLDFMPKEDRVKYSAMTGQSLFYMGETNLSHKILAIVEEEGAERASYALKLLQSERELTIASTGKDPSTGRLITHEYRVEGPVMIVLTTTAAEIDDELLNRAIVLTVNEDRAQTQAIHRLQRSKETLFGLLRRQEKGRRLRVHQNAQRLLRPLLVANPYAESLTFLDSQTRTRRDHMKYLVLIRSIALLHQHQRTVKTVEHEGEVIEYIEVTLEDIALANRLAHQVLGRSLDELAPQTRQLLVLLDRMVAELSQKTGVDRQEVRFSRREIRASTGWTYDQVRVHLERLIKLEYVLVHAALRGQTHTYELLYDGKGQSGEPFLVGLIDVESLRTVGSKREGLGGVDAGCGGSLVPHGAPNGAHLVTADFPEIRNASLPLALASRRTPKNAHPVNGKAKTSDVIRPSQRRAD